MATRKVEILNAKGHVDSDPHVYKSEGDEVEWTRDPGVRDKFTITFDPANGSPFQDAGPFKVPPGNSGPLKDVKKGKYKYTVTNDTTGVKNDPDIVVDP